MKKASNQYRPLQLADVDGFWRREYERLIDQYSDHLYPDEKTVSGFIRFLLKNAEQTIRDKRPTSLYE